MNDVRAPLRAIGWTLEAWDDGTPYAQDADNGALRIADRWGPDFEPQGFWTCGSRGPRGRWGSFEDAVSAAHEHHTRAALLAEVRELRAERECVGAILNNLGIADMPNLDARVALLAGDYDHRGRMNAGYRGMVSDSQARVRVLHVAIETSLRLIDNRRPEEVRATLSAALTPKES